MTKIKIEIVEKKTNKVLEKKEFDSVRQLEKFQKYFMIQADTSRYKLNTWTK